MKSTTRDWVRKAEADYRLAVKLARGTEPFDDQLCFHCQQASEKYLKALMEELALTIPKTHDLERLRVMLTSHPTGLNACKRGLAFLTNFAVPVRYPGWNASRRQATAALRWASRVRDACCRFLGIRPPRPRRRKS
jgi:HEPN domain-containing protein